MEIHPPRPEDFAGLSRAESIAKLRSVADSLSLSQRFVLLHELGICKGQESQSGDASSLDETRALRRSLPALLERHDVRKILDIPCGDMHWMRHVDLDGIDYVGADIVPRIVDANRRRLTGPRREFQILDATRDALPEVDLVLCRDLFIHLSLGELTRTLANFVASGSRLLLTSHFTSCVENVDISSGDFRPVNLCRPPFDLPPPIDVINEDSMLCDGDFRDRSMALWRLSDLVQVKEALDRE